MTLPLTRIYSIAATAVLVVGLGSMAYFAFAPRGGDPFVDCRRGQVAGGAAAIGGPFTLVNGDGVAVTDAEAITRPTLVYFGYGFCPDICPTDLARNALAADELADRGIEADQLFISIDPARDTPATVKDFTAAIHPDLVGLTGTPEQIAAAAAAYRVYYRQSGTDPETYLMDHSTFTYLMAPEHGLLEFFPSSDTPEQVADAAACFANAMPGG